MMRVFKPTAPWICLAETLVLFLLYLAWLHPTNWFGRYRDDAAYFSSAKALAEGRGYVIPSLPGEPPQTLYPVLYPWLLSWVWKWDPSFPSNIGPGVCLTAFFSCWFLVVAFQLLRKLEGVGDWPAFGIVFLCAFDPDYLFFSSTLMSDLPFMALALTAALGADKSMRAGGRLAPAVLVGAVAGLAVMMRTVGVAVVAGILLACLFRRAFRQAVAFCLGAAPLVGPVVWTVCRSLLGHRGVSVPGVASTLPGWQQTFFSYTSYLKSWRFCVPNLHVFWAMLRNNLQAATLAPAMYWLSPTLNIGHSLAPNALGAIVGAFSLAGILRQARRQEWKPLHFILPPYLAVLVLWQYPIMERFLLLFLPLLLLGLWVEGRNLAGLALSKLRPPNPAGDRLVAATLLVGLGAFVGIAAWNYAFGHRLELPVLSGQQKQMTQEKRQVYEWIRHNSAPRAVVVSDGDMMLYLYTGRQAVIPIFFSAQYVYTGDHRVLDRDLAHITDAACAVGARYWLTSEDDFHQMFQTAEVKERVARLLSGLPEVFRSQGGQVRLYDISALLQSLSAPCPPEPGP